MRSASVAKTKQKKQKPADATEFTSQSETDNHGNCNTGINDCEDAQLN